MELAETKRELSEHDEDSDDSSDGAAPVEIQDESDIAVNVEITTANVPLERDCGKEYQGVFDPWKVST